MKMPFNFSFKGGRFVRLFVLADLALLAGWGLINPIFALFIIDEIQGATVVTVGLAAAVYWIIKGAIQIPIANFLDKTSGEKDDFLVLVTGLVLASLSAFSFALVSEIWQLYAVQVIHAIAFGMYVPSWSGMFSRHLDKKHEALDWSLDSTAMSFAAGITGLLSGVIVKLFGFVMVFVLGGIFSLLSAIVIFFVPHIIFPQRKGRRGRVMIRDHKPITHVQD